MSARLSEQAILRIKSATRDLVRLCGGVVRAGEITNRSKSEVSRWQSVSEGDVIDILAALALEADVNTPLVTTVMAELNGRRLTDEVSAASAQSIMSSVAEVQRRAADLMTEVAVAFEDGTMTPAEAEIVDRTAAAKEDALRTLRSGLATVRAAGPSATSAPLKFPRTA